MAILKDLTVLGSVRFLQDLWGTIFHGDLDGKASNLAGGAAGSIPYQTAAGSTSFLSKGSNGQVLYIESNTLKWKNAGDTHTHSYLPLAGGTMTGTLTLLAGQYTDSYTSGGLNANNSNIIGLNSIYTADASDAQSEGIHFYRDATHVDTFRMAAGVMYFTPNRPVGGTGTEYIVWHSGNDGASSGLDADLLDGKHASEFATSEHAHDSTYVKLNSGTNEQTIKSSISSLSKGVVNLWRNSGDHYTFLGFSNGSTEKYLGGIGFKSQSDHNLYLKQADSTNTPSSSTTYYKIWHEGNDGASSGLDADLLDGKHASEFATSEHVHTTISNSELDTICSTT